MSEDKKIAEFCTGRRKRAVARVRIANGKGTFMVNRLPIDKYFEIEAIRNTISEPLAVIDKLGKVDVEAFVKGGGKTGQAEAIRLGLARALLVMVPDVRPTLKNAGFLKRDPREKERKKYGQPGARKRFQFSKR